MKILQGDVWKRRGVALLWGAAALSERRATAEVLSIREFFALAGNWPEDLPSNGGEHAGRRWPRGVHRPAGARGRRDMAGGGVAASDPRFPGRIRGEAALVFWLPTGAPRAR